MNNDSAAFSLMALSPLDGRYAGEVAALKPFFSELALNKFRLEVEAAYLLFLLKTVFKAKVSAQLEQTLRAIVDNFGPEQAAALKLIEKKIHHDVKAVEYFLKQELAELGEELVPVGPGASAAKIKVAALLHFGLTSEDTNSLAFGLALKAALHTVVVPELKQLIGDLGSMADRYKAVPMLARTHGQPAVATTFGKEVLVFAVRVAREVAQLATLPVTAKLSGAVGNWNSFQAALPQHDWLALSEQFITSLGLQPEKFTTQIVPADRYCKIFQSLELINSILIGFDQDIWRYISDGYVMQVKAEGQVGSSTMPQKVNPIQFENSEGNLGVANALLGYFNSKLPISRLQRDLSDSTVKRNTGSALGYCVLGYRSCRSGLKRISANEAVMKADLLNHWEILSEAIQTILRLAGDTAAYEKLQQFTQGKHITEQDITQFITSIEVSAAVKKQLKSLSPLTYLGLAPQLVTSGLKELDEVTA